jgi:hypothetical protein
MELKVKGLTSEIYFYRIELIGKGNIPVYSDMKKTILLKWILASKYFYFQSFREISICTKLDYALYILSAIR